MSRPDYKNRTPDVTDIRLYGLMQTRQPCSEVVIDLAPFSSLVMTQLELQGREPQAGPGGHPDPVIRSCYRAAFNVLSGGDTRYLDLISNTQAQRPDMDETHFVNLWFRAIQYSFRSQGQSQYLRFSDADWEQYLRSAPAPEIETIQHLLLTENTATHVLERYRSLAAALRLLAAGRPGSQLKVADIGCSLGLGFKACFASDFLSQPPFTDNTPGSQIERSLHLPLTDWQAAGVDIRIPTVDWVKACNYPSRYDQDGQKLDAAAQSLAAVSLPTYQFSVLDPGIVGVLTGAGLLDVVHSSMTMYELSPEEQCRALGHISRCLRPGGVFIDFTFIDPKDWFKGIHAVVTVNGDHGLENPLEWLIWTNSRCNEVGSGADFNEVSHILLS